MKRFFPILLIALMLVGGWFTGQRLAQPDVAQNPNKDTSGPPEKSSRSSTGNPGTDSGAKRHRNFAGEWNDALATEEWNSRKGPGVLFPLMLEWLKEDPNAALAGVRRLAQIEASKRIAGAAIEVGRNLFEHWVKIHGWDSAFAAARSLEGEERQRALEVVGKEAILLANDPADQLRSLLAGNDPATAREMISNSLRFWAYRADAPATAATDWVESLPPGSFDAAASVLLDRAAAQARLIKDPQGAATWLLSRANDETRSGHLESIVSVWVQEAPNACGEWLRRQPVGPQANAAFETFALRITREDPASAWHWAQRISDPHRRDMISQNVMEKWRVLDPAGAASALPAVND